MAAPPGPRASRVSTIRIDFYLADKAATGFLGNTSLPHRTFQPALMTFRLLLLRLKARALDPAAPRRAGRAQRQRGRATP